MRKNTMRRKKTLCSIAVLAVCGAMFSGCSSKSSYQAVVDEVNAEYGVQLSVDFNGKTDLSPEQFRAHIEALARQMQAKI